MKRLQLPLKLFTVIGVLSIFFFACNSDDDSAAGNSREAFFNYTTHFSNDNQILGNKEDSLKIDIETNSYWKIEKEKDADNEWVSVKPGKGTGSAEVTVEVQKNSTVGLRSAWLHFSAFEYKDSLKVSQKGQDLAISEKTFEHVSADGEDFTLTLEAVNAWISEKEENASWFSLDPFEGEAGQHELTVTVKKNETDSTRTDSIAFMSAGSNDDSKLWLTVSQDGMKQEEPSLKLDKSEENVQADSGSVDVALTSNINWQASTEAEGVEISPAEGKKEADAQEITITYPENTTSEARTFEITFAGKEPHDTLTQKFQIKQLGVTASEITVEKNIIDIDGQNQIFTVELTSSNVDWKAVSNDSRFVISENSSGTATTDPVQIKVNASKNNTYQTFTGTLEIQKADDPEVKTEVVINQGLHPLNDESLVYSDPSKTAAQLGLDRGVPHPKVEGWKFWNAHEFTNDAAGFWNFNTKGGIENAAFSDDMKVVKDGTLKIKTKKLGTPIKNRFGESVDYETAPLYSKRHDQGGTKWVKFTTNMRVEVRFRSSNTTGFNEALWFMGQSNYDSQKTPWPDNGEIDLMESPFSNESHFSLHSKNFSANTGNAETASVKLPDMKKWNIYWVEIHEDRITGGINGYQYFEHKKGDGGNNDWPWDNPAGMMMIISPGIGGWSGQMPNMSAGEEAFMELDWIRVYTNDKFDESSQAGHNAKYY